jgi:hypothetical protein
MPEPPDHAATAPAVEDGSLGAPGATARAAARRARPWWSLAAVPLFAVGLWTLLADVPGWNALWYLFAWYGWLLALDAAVWALSGRSWVAAQGRRLPALLFWSVPFWYLFEAYNLRLENWYYVFALRDDALQLVVSVLAFATVFPACFLHAELIAALGMWDRARWRPLRVSRGVELGLGAMGAASIVAPIVWPRVAFPLVWGATFWLPELVSWRRGGPSLVRDLARGRPQRLLQLLVGGLLAGVVWELLNFWARCKWIYTVPYFERLKLFEMPMLGFLGFPFLALGAFATWSLLSRSVAPPGPDGGDRDEARVAATAAPLSPRRRVLVLAAGALAALFCVQVFHQVLAHTVRSRRPALDELAGLGADDAAALERAGVPTPERLERAVAARGMAGVAAAAGIAPSALEPAARHATLALHKGMGSAAASLLLAVGVPDVAALGNEDAGALAARLRARGDRTGEPVPRDAEVRVWVAAARGRAPPRR